MGATSSAAAMRQAVFESSPRVGSIDVVRGAVMVLMAIDHARVYSGVPAGNPQRGQNVEADIGQRSNGAEFVARFWGARVSQRYAARFQHPYATSVPVCDVS